MRTLPQFGKETVEAVTRPLGHDLDRITVREIAHVACEPSSRGAVDHEVAEADTLDSPANNRVQ